MTRPITAYAVVKKKNPRLNLIDLYESKDVNYDKESEIIIKVEIKEIKNEQNRSY